MAVDRVAGELLDFGDGCDLSSSAFDDPVVFGVGTERGEDPCVRQRSDLYGQERAASGGLVLGPVEALVGGLDVVVEALSAAARRSAYACNASMLQVPESRTATSVMDDPG